MNQLAEKVLKETVSRYPSLAPCEGDIVAAFEALEENFARGGTLYLCGNGGSASDCAHIAGELLKSFNLPRPITGEEKIAIEHSGERGEYLASRLQRALPAISLCEHTALTTAFANDVDGELTYAQLAYALAKKGEVLLCISTSGNARNCLYAAQAAKSKGVLILGLTGKTGGEIGKIADICIRVPETKTYLVQELHLPVYHCLCAMLEAEFFG